MLCPRCGSKIKNGNNCDVCGYQLSNGEYIKKESKIKQIIRYLLLLVLVYYSIKFLVYKHIFSFLIGILGIVLITPFIRNKVAVISNLNRVIRYVILFAIFFVVFMNGALFNQEEEINNFINKYQLKDEFEQIGVDDIQEIKITHSNEDTKYPSIIFDLTNTEGKTYTGLITGYDYDKYELLSFTKYDSDTSITKNYYASSINYDENNNLLIDIYDYHNDKLIKKGIQESSTSNKEIIEILSGETNEYSIAMPFDDGKRTFYKLPEGKTYRVTRRANGDSDISTSFVWQDYDKKIVSGENVSYENYKQYEFENDETVQIITIEKDTHLDLTGDYFYTFEEK